MNTMFSALTITPAGRSFIPACGQSFLTQNCPSAGRELALLLSPPSLDEGRAIFVSTLPLSQACPCWRLGGGGGESPERPFKKNGRGGEEKVLEAQTMRMPWGAPWPCLERQKAAQGTGQI